MRTIDWPIRRREPDDHPIGYTARHHIPGVDPLYLGNDDPVTHGTRAIVAEARAER